MPNIYETVDMLNNGQMAKPKTFVEILEKQYVDIKAGGSGSGNRSNHPKRGGSTVSHYKTGDGKKFLTKETAIAHSNKHFAKTGNLISVVEVHHKPIAVGTNGPSVYHPGDTGPSKGDTGGAVKTPSAAPVRPKISAPTQTFKNPPRGRTVSDFI